MADWTLRLRFGWFLGPKDIGEPRFRGSGATFVLLELGEKLVSRHGIGCDPWLREDGRLDNLFCVFLHRH